MIFNKFKTILPSLTEEYNKNYYVKASTIKTRILRKSGYAIIHRPYFAMKDSTHDVVTINPYKKECIDAAPINESVITFKDFLKIFKFD